MWDLDTIIRMNAGINTPELPGHRLRSHPRIHALYRRIASLPVDEEYRRWLFRSLNRYADQIVERPTYHPEEGWDDLEAIQQVTLSDMNALALRRSARRFMDGGA